MPCRRSERGRQVAIILRFSHTRRHRGCSRRSHEHTTYKKGLRNWYRMRFIKWRSRNGSCLRLDWGCTWYRALITVHRICKTYRQTRREHTKIMRPRLIYLGQEFRSARANFRPSTLPSSPTVVLLLASILFPIASMRRRLRRRFARLADSPWTCAGSRHQGLIRLG